MRQTVTKRFPDDHTPGPWLMQFPGRISVLDLFLMAARSAIAKARGEG